VLRNFRISGFFKNGRAACVTGSEETIASGAGDILVPIERTIQPDKPGSNTPSKKEDFA